MERTVLVVDDSGTVRKFVSVALEMQGFIVITACDGMDALEKLPRQTVDLVITDLNMPNMDGFEFIRTLRQTPEYRNLPVVVLSSLADKENKALGMEAGANSYLVKPFSPEKVQYEVSKYINRVEERERS